MVVFMNENFIAKLTTDNYLIGSFDAFLDATKSLIKNNSNLDDVVVEKILKDMPFAYRAAITTKDGKYIGYIGLYNVNFENNSASIRFETEVDLDDKDKKEIEDEFIKFLSQSLNITDIEEYNFVTKNKMQMERKKIIPSCNIIMANKLLIPGVSEEDLEFFSKDYFIPKLQYPFTIKNNDRVIGIIGLSSINWPNKRANLNIFLDKSLGEDIVNELSGYLIDDYINYVHSSNIHSVFLSVNGSNNDLLNILNNTQMNYFGFVPYGTANGGNIETSLMFQHIPRIRKEKGILIPDNNFVASSVLDTPKKELSPKIELSNGFKMIKPSLLEQENIDFDSVLKEHISVLQNREGFTIPLGEDKYFLQKGNGNYGVSKAFANYNYIILDDLNHYAGYINILRSNADGKNVEIEIGINPVMQHRGLGTATINAFYDELFSIGVASVTSTVFEFNNSSIRLHEKVAQLNGVRLESYYINGKLWNMNTYSKVNSLLEDTNEKKALNRL